MSSIALQEPSLFSSFLYVKEIKLATHIISRTRTKRDREMCTLWAIRPSLTSSSKTYGECASFKYNRSAGEDERREWRKGAGCSMPDHPVCPGLLYPQTIFMSVKMPVVISRLWRMAQTCTFLFLGPQLLGRVKKKKRSGRVSPSSYAANGVASRSPLWSWLPFLKLKKNC